MREERGRRSGAVLVPCSTKAEMKIAPTVIAAIITAFTEIPARVAAMDRALPFTWHRNY